MANKKFLLGILVMALVFGMTVIGCDDGSGGGGSGGTDPALNGTWIMIEAAGGPPMNQHRISYNNGVYEESRDGSPQLKGTYTTSGDQITATTTHLHGNFVKLDSSKWYSKNELDTKYHYRFDPFTQTYSIEDDILTFLNQGGYSIWRRDN